MAPSAIASGNVLRIPRCPGRQRLHTAATRLVRLRRLRSHKRSRRRVAAGSEFRLPRAAAPAPTAYNEMRLKAEHEDANDDWSIFYVPGERMIAFRDQDGLSRFRPRHRHGADAVPPLHAGSRALPRSGHRAATVGGKASRAPRATPSCSRCPGSRCGQSTRTISSRSCCNASRPRPGRTRGTSCSRRPRARSNAGWTSSA